MPPIEPVPVPVPGSDPTPCRTRRRAAAYLALGLAWAVLAGAVAPALIEAAYRGQGPAPLNRFFEGRTARPLDHYLWLWRSAWVAVLIAGACHLALWSRVDRFDGRSRRVLVGFALAFLGVTLLSGPRHDYVADLEIWDEVMAGRDPWWLQPGRGYPLNAYGPLFNALAPVAWLNPMAPKLLFASAYLLFAVGQLERLRANRGLAAGLPLAGQAAWLWNPLPWVEIAYFGHFDILVALACLVASRARLAGRDRASGAWLAAGVLLKYLPIVILPFLAVEGRRVRWRLLLAALGLTAAGLAASLLAWGPSTFRPLEFAATRGSNLLSIFRFLRGEYSPLRRLEGDWDSDAWSLPVMAVGGLAVFAWCQARRVGPAVAPTLAVLTTLLGYRVGFVQYQIVPFVLLSGAAVDAPAWWGSSRLRAVAAAAYFGWLAAFDLFYASIHGVIDPAGPWAWVEDAAGLPTFLLGLFLLGALLRGSGRL